MSIAAKPEKIETTKLYAACVQGDQEAFAEGCNPKAWHGIDVEFLIK